MKKKEFLLIQQKIRNANLNDEEWSLIESDDTFQTEHYIGGYDATEKAFCFSYYDDDNEEFWFQISLNDLLKLTEKDFDKIETRKAEY